MDKILADTLGSEATPPAANEKQLLLSRLLARLAHEIRNPLSSLGIHVQLLEEDLAQATPRLRAQAAGRFEIIRGELHRLENLMRQFLSLAAPSSVDLQPVDLVEVVRYVGDLLRPEAAARGIALALDVPADLPMLSADSAQLKQALVNLIINAIQAVERKGRVEVSAVKSIPDNVLLLRVQDNGPGIAAEKLADIFDPYFTTKPEGNGLGLWIAQQIAVAHGGTLNAANAQAGGAILTLALPLQRKEKSGG